MNGHVNNSKYLDWIFLRLWDRTFDQVYSKENQSQVCQKVRPGGMIASAYELKGLKASMRLSMMGDQCPAMITRQEIEGN